MSEPWRVGEHYGIHVYEGDRPVATFHRAEDALRTVVAVNVTEASDDLIEAVAAAAWGATHMGKRPPAWAGFSTADPVAQDVFRGIARAVIPAIRAARAKD